MRHSVLLSTLLLTAAALTGMALTGMAQAQDFFDGEKPAVQTADRVEWAWDGGDRVGIAVPATVHYQPGGTPRVIVKGPSDLLARVRYDHGELGLARSMFDWNWNGEKLDVTLTGMTLRQVALAGRVDMDMGALKQDRLQISIAGRGMVEASGHADDLLLKIAGSGEYKLGKLTAQSLQVKIAGSGQVDAGAADHADVNIAGSGDVHFASAMPKDIQTRISGSGTVSDAEGRTIGRREARNRREDFRQR
jgi:hypothetical protein